MRLGTYLPVEIAGVTIGDAILSEVTDEFVEVVYLGQAIRLPATVLDYIEMTNDINGVSI